MRTLAAAVVIVFAFTHISWASPVFSSSTTLRSTTLVEGAAAPGLEEQLLKGNFLSRSTLSLFLVGALTLAFGEGCMHQASRSANAPKPTPAVSAQAAANTIRVLKFESEDVTGWLKSVKSFPGKVPNEVVCLVTVQPDSNSVTPYHLVSAYLVLRGLDPEKAPWIHVGGVNVRQLNLQNLTVASDSQWTSDPAIPVSFESNAYQEMPDGTWRFPIQVAPEAMTNSDGTATARVTLRFVPPAESASPGSGMEEAVNRAIDVAAVKQISEPISVFVDPSLLGIPTQQAAMQLHEIQEGLNALEGAPTLFVYADRQSRDLNLEAGVAVLQIVPDAGVKQSGWTMALTHLGSNSISVNALPALILHGITQPQERFFTVDATPYLNLQAVTLQAVLSKLAELFA